MRERSEKWLVSRCLRGRVRCTDFKFQDVQLGMEWLVLSQRHGLRDLGWYGELAPAGSCFNYR